MGVCDNDDSHNNDELLSNSESDDYFKELDLFTAIRTIIHRIYNASDNRMFQYAVKTVAQVK